MARFAKKNVGVTTKKFYGGGPAKSPNVVRGGDARLKIIAKKRSKVVDARDNLAIMAKSTDARQKLQKIRNYKKGLLDVKTTANGNITIVTKTNGSLQLTTKKKTANTTTPTGLQTPTANSVLGLQSKSAKNAALAKRQAAARNRTNAGLAATAAQRGVIKKRAAVPIMKQHPAMGAIRTDGRLTRTIQSEAALLDEELINTRVDPRLIQQTLRYGANTRSSNMYRQSSETVYTQKAPLYTRGHIEEQQEADYYRSRPPPPSFTTVPPRHYDYDDIRREQELEDEMLRRRLLAEQAVAAEQMSLSRTMADRVAESGGSYVSPLQGTKVIVSNLQSSVSQEDIIELFGDVGALKRAKTTGAGTAEVVFVNKADALKAVEIYNKRLLDAKPMICQIVGATPTAYSESKVAAFPRSNASLEGLRPEMSAIHKALFVGSDNKKTPSATLAGRPHFTVVMPPTSAAGRKRFN